MEQFPEASSPDPGVKLEPGTSAARQPEALAETAEAEAEAEVNFDLEALQLQQLPGVSQDLRRLGPTQDLSGPAHACTWVMHEFSGWA